MLNTTTIASLLRDHIKPVFLLGAGASVRSGIPPAATMVDQIAKWSYCRANDFAFDDPTVMRSDWLRWLHKETWYRKDVDQADQYAAVVERLLRPQESKREFFRRILRPGVPASRGYHALSKLLQRREIRTVLTTNFDSLVVDTARTYPVHQIDEIRTRDDQQKFSVDPSFPQVVYLHGSIDHYTDKNLETETQHLDESLVELLRPLLRDHPLVIVGYRGGEQSIVNHLLKDQVAACAGFKHGIYWCHLSCPDSFAPPPLVGALEEALKGNLQFVQIDGFDELMVLLENSHQGRVPENEIPTRADTVQSTTHDLESAHLGLDALSRSVLRERILAYCESQRLAQPDVASDADLYRVMEARGLAIQLDGVHTVTKSALLLFAKSADCQLRGAKIEVAICGPVEWASSLLGQSFDSVKAEPGANRIVIEGHLWGQLDQVSDLLARVNKPFRLKTASSHDVYPYPPLALKELLTNLLAHRDYRDESVAAVTIEPDKISFQNVGGLVDIVQRQIGEDALQVAVSLGAGRVKGYRNPVIAEFFYSSGAMDKEGSGLHDVLTDAANNLNDITFGPTAENSGFIAVIRSRPEALGVDRVSKTAKPAVGELRYSPNLLRVMSWPKTIYKLGSTASFQELAKVERLGVAPFFAFGEWIWAFAHPDDPTMRLLRDLAIPEEIHAVSSSEMLRSAGTPNGLPRLLNGALASHLRRLGMRVRFEAGRLRAYFPSDDGQPREISYRSQFKAAKRFVAKPVVSRSTGRLSYWEHKAVSLRFERFANEWSLSLVPTYLFTEDGDARDIAAERIGALSTRRASRDYNPTVLHDVVFWSRMISQTGEPTFRIVLSESYEEASAGHLELEAMIPTLVFQEPADAFMSSAMADDVADPEMADLEEEIAQLVEDAKETSNAPVPDN